jgi:hypothetical protein
VKFLTVLDRIFGILVPICLIAFLVMAWWYLARTEEGPSPIRLRIMPRRSPPPLPPAWRRAAASRERWMPAINPPRAPIQVKGKRGESAGRAALAAAVRQSGMPGESVRSGAAGAENDIAGRTRGPVEDHAGLILGA